MMGLAAKHPLPQRGRFWSTRPDRLLQRHSHPHRVPPPMKPWRPTPLRGSSTRHQAAGAALMLPVLRFMGAGVLLLPLPLHIRL